jgi:hypothetical protein
MDKLDLATLGSTCAPASPASQAIPTNKKETSEENEESLVNSTRTKQKIVGRMNKL